MTKEIIVEKKLAREYFIVDVKKNV